MKTSGANLEDTVSFISNCIKRLQFYDRHFLMFFSLTCFLAFSTICYTMWIIGLLHFYNQQTNGSETLHSCVILGSEPEFHNGRGVGYNTAGTSHAILTCVASCTLYFAGRTIIGCYIFSDGWSCPCSVLPILAAFKDWVAHHTYNMSAKPCSPVPSAHLLGSLLTVWAAIIPSAYAEAEQQRHPVPLCNH